MIPIWLCIVIAVSAALVCSVFAFLIGIEHRKKKAESLMKTFKTLTNIKTLSVAELMEADGISERDAKNIYDYFNS